MNYSDLLNRVMNVAKKIDNLIAKDYAERGYSSLHERIAGCTTELRKVAWRYTLYSSYNGKKDKHNPTMNTLSETKNTSIDHILPKKPKNHDGNPFATRDK